MDPSGAQSYYECICNWMQHNEATMRQLLDQIRGSNSALCTQTECFESGTWTWAGRGRRERERGRKGGRDLGGC